MKSWITRTFTVLALAMGLTIGIPATAAHAINRVGCFEHGYLDISSHDVGNVCYANAGETELDIVEVWHFWAGNNAGYIEVREQGGGVYHRHFSKWEEFYLNNAYVSFLHIR